VNNSRFFGSTHGNIHGFRNQSYMASGRQIWLLHIQGHSGWFK
jgi:hypothetical protein